MKAFKIIVSTTVFAAITFSANAGVTDLTCPLKTKNPYQELSGSLSSLDSAFKSLDRCVELRKNELNGDDQATAKDLMALIKGVEASIVSLKPFHEGTTKAISIEDYENTVSGLVGSIQSISSFLQNSSDQLAVNKCYQAVYKDGSFLNSLSRIVQTLSPYALVAVDSLGVEALATMEPMLMSVAGAAAVFNAFSAGDVSSINMYDESQRRTVVDQTCNFINLKRRYSSYTMARIGGKSVLVDIINNIKKQIKSKKDAYKNNLDQKKASVLNDYDDWRSIKSKAARDKRELTQIKEDLGLNFFSTPGVPPGQGWVPGQPIVPPSQGNGNVITLPFGTDGMQLNATSDDIDNLDLKQLFTTHLASNPWMNGAQTNNGGYTPLPIPNSGTGQPAFPPGQAPVVPNQNMVADDIMCSYVGRALTTTDNELAVKFPFSVAANYDLMVSKSSERRQGILRARLESFNQAINKVRASKDDRTCASETMWLLQTTENMISLLEAESAKVLEKFPGKLAALPGYSKWKQEVDALILQKKFRQQEVRAIELLSSGEGAVEVSEFNEEFTAINRFFFLGKDNDLAGDIFARADNEPMVFYWLDYKLQRAQKSLDSFEAQLNDFVAKREAKGFSKAYAIFTELFMDKKSEVEAVSNAMTVVQKDTSEHCSNLRGIAEEFFKAQDHLAAAETMCKTLSPFLTENDQQVDSTLYKMCNPRKRFLYTKTAPKIKILQDKLSAKSYKSLQRQKYEAVLKGMKTQGCAGVSSQQLGAL